MIENLNAISFVKYGKVVHEGFQYACSFLESESIHIEEKCINLKTIDNLICLSGSALAMDIVDGVALLYAAISPSLDQGKLFLLDKAIILNPGIHYAVISLYGSCTIRHAHTCSAQKLSVGIAPISGPLGLYPKVEISKVHTLFYQEKEKDFTFKGEKHDFWELTYVDKGIMYTNIEGAEYKLGQGEAIFYGNSQYHTQWSETGISTSFVTITFDMDFDESSILTGKKFAVDQEMRELISKIISEKEQNSIYANDLIICYIKEFIIKLVRNEKLEITIHHQDSVIKNKIENSIISKCLSYIENNIGTKISVPNIAKSIPVSQSYLSAIFKKAMDMTLVDYINHFRLEKSKDLIKSTEYNFTQISEILGYTSVHYFSNQFKLKYGISPSEYAKSIKR